MTDLPGLTELRAAEERVREVVVRTPLVPLHDYRLPRSKILLKPEIHQAVTSFKVRGVFNAVAALTDDERARGLSTVSAGNTAQALAWVGQHFGVPARSIMPEGAPKTKIDAVVLYGGEPVLVPTSEVFRFLEEHLWENEPYAFIHPWTNRDLMLGHASLGLEIVDELPEVQTVYIPVGGGGLLGGVGSAIRALRPDVRLVAVEPAGCPALSESLRQGKPAAVECQTICDGVAVPYITEEMYPILAAVTDDVVLVSEQDVRASVRRLFLGNRMVVEPSGALSVAAALQSDHPEPAVCLITGGSIDRDKLIGILNEE